MKNLETLSLKARLRQSGNIVFTLFGLLAGAGVIGGTTMAVLKGPVSNSAQLSKQKITATAMDAAARLIGSPEGPTTDCDTDSSLEPVAWQVIAGKSAPVGGGFLPDTLGAAKADPWGSVYGYCVWDHGTKTLVDNDPACGGTTALRLPGGVTRTEPVIAIISAGPDKIFQTTCNAWLDANADSKPDTPLVAKLQGNDDLVHTENLDTLVKAGGDTQIPSYPDEACTPETVGLMRFEMDTVQVCTEDGWEEVGASVAANGVFNPTTGVELSTEHTSNTITFSGYFGTRTATANNGAVIIVNGDTANAAATKSIAAGDTVALKATAAATPSTPSVFTLTLGAIQRSWTITTRLPHPAFLTITPTSRTMNVTGPGSPAVGTTQQFLVRNTGEVPAVMGASQLLPNNTNFFFNGLGDNCSGKTLTLGGTDSCAIEVAPRATGPGALIATTLRAVSGSVNASAALSGSSLGWPCNLAANTTWIFGGQTCHVPTATAINDGAFVDISDTSQPVTGTARFSCTNGTINAPTNLACANTGDIDPVAFGWTAQGGAGLGETRTSNVISITGINMPATVTVSGPGSPAISIAGGPWVTSGSISNNQTLAVRMTASGGYSSTHTATVTVGPRSGTWSLTTAAPSNCTLPAGTPFVYMGVTCNITVGATIPNGGAATLSDESDPTYGSATFTCNAGVATPGSDAFCMLWEGGGGYGSGGCYSCHAPKDSAMLPDLKMLAGAKSAHDALATKQHFRQLEWVPIEAKGNVMQDEPKGLDALKAWLRSFRLSSVETDRFAENKSDLGGTRQE